jgi:hypothetical protein
MIIEFIQSPAAFDPEAVTVMGDAYQRVLDSLDIEPPKSVREVIAARIIGMARGGERDPRKLYEESRAILGMLTDRS